MERDYFTCREMVELVTEYLEGALTLHERAMFEAHLSVCRGCTAYLEQMRQTIRLTGTLSEETIPQPVREELLEIFRDWRR